MAAIWVTFTKARRLPAIHSETAYKTANSFRRAVRREAAGSAVWARRKTGFGGLNDATLEVDLSAIPGVIPTLQFGGRKVS